VQDLHADGSRRLNAPHDAVSPEGRPVDLEAKIEMFPRNTAGADYRLKETAVETYVQDLPLA
jgi:hypothetical protein